MRRLLPLVCALLAFAAAQLTAQAAERLNVIVVLVDDCGLHAFSCYGGTTAQTPNIDRIAAQGVRFTNFHAMPICGPSRAALMTGLYGMRHDPVPDGHRLMPHYLQRAGYHTAFLGKHMVKSVAVDPIGQGFDQAMLSVNGYRFWNPHFVFFDCTGPYAAYNQAPVVVNEWEVPFGYAPELPQAGAGTQFTDAYHGDMIATQAEHLIGAFATDDDPFFLYLALKLDHVPLTPTPLSTEYDEAHKLQDQMAALLPGESWAQYNTRMRETGGETVRLGRPEYRDDVLVYLDHVMGRLDQALQDAGVAEDTLILITGDNGNNLGKPADPADALLGGKGDCTDGATRVPLVVRWPAGAPAGRVLHDPVQLCDIMPTVVELGGGAIDDQPVDGISFAPRLRGGDTPVRDWVYLHGGTNNANIWNRRLEEWGWELPYADPALRPEPMVWRWMRGERYKLYGDGRLYDMVADKNETTPIAPGTGGEAAERARVVMQAGLDELDDRARWTDYQDFLQPSYWGDDRTPPAAPTSVRARVTP